MMTPQTTPALPAAGAAFVASKLDAVAAGPSTIAKDTQQLYAAGFAKHAGYLLGGFGSYGTDYTERAVISQVGLGAFVAHQAIYAMAWSDSGSRAACAPPAASRTRPMRPNWRCWPTSIAKKRR